MKVNKILDLKVEEAFESLDQINKVKISNSFKSRVLNKLEEEQAEESIVFNWFTPKLQLAAVAVIILVNLSAVMYSFSSSSNETSINSFAQEYNLSINSTSITN